MTPHPESNAQPYSVEYDELRPLIMEGGQLLTAQEAERRVLVLENPGLRGQSRPTQSLYARSPADPAWRDRRDASSRRFGAALRRRGPRRLHGGRRRADDDASRRFHPDALVDLSRSRQSRERTGHLARRARCADREPVRHELCRAPPEETQPVSRREGDANLRYGANLLPVDFAPTRLSSPVFIYPYARSRETLEQLYRHGPVHACHGVEDALRQSRHRRLSDADNRSVPAIAAEGVPGRGRTARPTPRSTRRSRVAVKRASADQMFPWGPRDIFVVPSWAPVSHDGLRGRRAVQFLRSPRTEGARPVARGGPRATMTTPPRRLACCFTTALHRASAVLPHRPDRSELEHDDGNGDSRPAADARERRAGAVHVPFEPHADEEGHERGAGGNGRRFRPLRRGARRTRRSTSLATRALSQS